MHITDHQEGDTFYEVRFVTEEQKWVLSVTRPNLVGPDPLIESWMMTDEIDELLAHIKEHCPPILEKQVKDWLKK